MLDSKIVEKLRIRYEEVHPLLFHRSLDRAKSNGELFDILDTLPKEYPIYWCEESNCWKSTSDLYLSEEFFGPS